MELLTRTFRNLRRWLGPDAWFSAGILAVVISLEAIGRHDSSSDLHDLMSVTILVMLAWLVIARHAHRPLPWVGAVAALLRRGRAYLHARGLEIGVDFRGVPPLPSALPRRVLHGVAGLVVWTAALLVAIEVVPFPLRNLAARVFYLGYLVLLTALWAALALSIVAAFIIPTALIHDAFVNRFDGPGRRSRRLEVACLFAYFAVLLMAASLLPPWAALLACVAALAINLLTVALPANADVKFVWRYRTPEAPVCSIPWGQWVICEFTILTLATVDLVLMACGEALLGDAPARTQVMPITTGLGLLLAWLAPGALGVLVLQAILGRMRDPARPTLPLAHVGGSAVSALRDAARAILQQRGWQARFAPEKPQPLDVRIELVEGARPAPDDAWPLRLDAEALADDLVMDRLARRDEIQKRRRLTAGLERLFKHAARFQYRNGSGFWIAPHYWFVPGFSRDTPEDELNLAEGTILTGIIGPPYHRLLPQSVRHHAYRILRALQVDLIFVEDGVGFKRFVRIFRMMFEVFDVHGGRRRAEEVQFSGVPGTRVMIHEFVLDEPFRSEVYPEPDYENLGRARIFHIFRDRGEQEEPLETPGDFSFMPAPSMAN